VDRLNEDPDYTSLIKLLQRARLIPTLNKLKEATLFAPTNDAISRKPLWQAALDDTADSLRDNVQEKLRQELFYHILNYTLPSLPVDENPQVHKTLLFPHKLPDAPSREPPPNPPWLPTPSGTLGDEPQRLRVSQLQGQVRVGVNASGLGGTAVVKGTVHANNGILLGINDVLDVPPDLGTSLHSLTIRSQSLTLSFYKTSSKCHIETDDIVIFREDCETIH
jgi:solute carrier family 25 carnitine/acylcarnitine transporter 20/29